MAAAIAVWALVGAIHGQSQEVGRSLPVSPECVGRIQTAVTHVAAGLLPEANAELAVALTHTETDTSRLCAGLILHNMATIASISGRYSEAERLATRSVAALEKVYPPDHPALLRPLLLLASTRLEQGNKSGAHTAFNRLKDIRPAQPHDRAMIHALMGTLLHSGGERQQAEVEFLAALDGATEVGSGEMADVASVLTSLGMLYVEERRFEDARRTVDRASAILSRASDAALMDRSKLLGVRGLLHARLREWPLAEKDFRDGLALIDGQRSVDQTHILFLMTGFAEALDKNHHRREAREIRAREAALAHSNTSGMVVDISDLTVRPKPAKR